MAKKKNLKKQVLPRGAHIGGSSQASPYALARLNLHLPAGTPFPFQPYLPPGVSITSINGVAPVSYPSPSEWYVVTQPGKDQSVGYRLGISSIGAGVAGLLFVSIGDGVLPPQRFPVNMPVQNSQVTGTLQITAAALGVPFNKTLYGYHMLQLDVFYEDPNGAVLPAGYQRNPPDPKLYSIGLVDGYRWFIWPGCTDAPYATPGAGGVDFMKIAAFNADTTSVELTAGGSHIAANQKITVSWNVQTGGFAPTAFGFNGSGQVYIVNGFVGGDENPFSAGTVVPGPLSGQRTLDISGLPYNASQAYIRLRPWGECGDGRIAQTKYFQGKIVAPPPQAAALQVYYGDYVTTPDNMTADEDFVATFYVRNVGGVASGAFNVHLDLDNGQSTWDVAMQSLNPGYQESVWWHFASGLSAGSHSITVSITGQQPGTQVVAGINGIDPDLF